MAVASCHTSQAFSANERRGLSRPFTSGLLVLALVVVPAGCGGDDEDGSKTAAPETATTSTAETERSDTATAPGEDTTPPDTSTDEGGVPGGPGDEEPARSPALLTGNGGRIRPRLVRVPPYIAVSVELHSADGDAYGLRFGKQSVDTSERETSSVLLAGLRPGARAVGKPFGGRGNQVVIEASAEPGP